MQVTLSDAIHVVKQAWQFALRCAPRLLLPMWLSGGTSDRSALAMAGALSNEGKILRQAASPKLLLENFEAVIARKHNFTWSLGALCYLMPSWIRMCSGKNRNKNVCFCCRRHQGPHWFRCFLHRTYVHAFTWHTRCMLRNCMCSYCSYHGVGGGRGCICRDGVHDWPALKR